MFTPSTPAGLLAKSGEKTQKEKGGPAQEATEVAAISINTHKVKADFLGWNETAFNKW
jgi:hypothetical protein